MCSMIFNVDHSKTFHEQKKGKHKKTRKPNYLCFAVTLRMYCIHSTEICSVIFEMQAGRRYGLVMIYQSAICEHLSALLPKKQDFITESEFADTVMEFVEGDPSIQSLMSASAG